MIKLSEEDKPKEILLKVTIPTKESIIDGMKKMFPTLEVTVIEEEPKAEEP